MHEQEYRQRNETNRRRTASLLGFVMDPPPYQQPGFSYPSSRPSMSICNPAVPLTTGIPNGLYHGQMIFIAGSPTTNAKRFNINIQDERCVDIGFHFDVRFSYLGEVNTIVRNHRSCSTWFQEERGIPYFPFVPNAYFEMIILCGQSGFKVAVNNHHFLEFKHRLMPFAGFNTLNISGDVIINQVKFQ